MHCTSVILQPSPWALLARNVRLLGRSPSVKGASGSGGLSAASDEHDRPTQAPESGPSAPQSTCARRTARDHRFQRAPVVETTTAGGPSAPALSLSPSSSFGARPSAIISRLAFATVTRRAFPSLPFPSLPFPSSQPGARHSRTRRAPTSCSGSPPPSSRDPHAHRDPASASQAPMRT